MRILVGYATTEGHTRAIARFVAERLAASGRQVGLADLAEPIPPDPAGFDAVVLAGSLHVGRYQPQLVHFARRHAVALHVRPAAFVSVSLSAAGDDPDDWAGLKVCLDRFVHETGWTPTDVHQAAGAIRFSAYDFFKKLAIKYIAERRGRHVKLSEDYDYTDYEALGRFVDRFVEEAKAAAPPV